MPSTLTPDLSRDLATGGLLVAVDLAAGRLALAGELDRETCGHLAAACQVMTASGPPIWVVDLAALAFCDLPGLRALGGACRAAEDAGRALVLVGARPFLRRLLSLGGLDDALAPLPPRATGPG